MARNTRPEWMIIENVKQLQEQNRQNTLAAEMMKMDKKAMSKTFSRRVELEKSEAETEKKIELERNAALIEKQKTEDKFNQDKITSHLEEMKELKIRQQLWESVEELRNLKVKLRAAYIGKEVVSQIAEKKAIAMEQKMMDDKFDDFHRKLAIAKEQEQKEAEEAFIKKQRFKEDLDNQILGVEAYMKQQRAYKQFLEEREMINQIARELQEERLREEQEHAEKLLRTKQEIEEFRRMQAVWKQMEKETLEEEDRRLKEYIEIREKQELKRLEEVKEQMEVKKKLEERKEADFIYHQKIQLAKEEMDQVMREVDAERLHQIREERYREEMAAVLRKKQELNNIYKEQLVERKRKLEEEEAQERLYQQQLLEEMAKGARLDQLTRERSRQKMMNFKAQVREMMEYRRQQRMNEMQQCAEMEKLHQAQEKHRVQLIEEERLRLLKKHAGNLFGYLPKGVLREDDITHLGSEFFEKYNDFLTSTSSRRDPSDL